MDIDKSVVSRIHPEYIALNTAHRKA